MADKGGSSYERISKHRLVLSQSLLTEDVVEYPYTGGGTTSNHYIVDWIPNDARNPMNMSKGMKWIITATMALGTPTVTFSFSTLSRALPQIQDDLHASLELSVLSVSLLMLGFAIAPMTWSPLS